MKAQTLGICIPGTTCDKNCPYCVSKMTWAPVADWNTWMQNLRLARAFAERSDVMDVIVTGKGEPMLSPNSVLEVAMEFRTFPAVLQTNGVALSRDPSVIEHLTHIEVIAVSVDSPDQFEDVLGPLWVAVNRAGKISRATVLLTYEVMKKPFMWWVGRAKRMGIRQLSFREVTIPSDCIGSSEATEVAGWIKTHISGRRMEDWLADYLIVLSPFREIRRLSYGAVVKDANGVAVTFFEYCVQDENGEEDIRSLIYNQDGHLYTTWNSPASMVF